ncbi:NTP transferase domain-containing protein [bacterium]|nr:NTP transferase domain-containing protein [bacterium]
MRVAVVMAGGMGERLWPLSHFYFPKQFLSFSGRGPMLSEAVERARSIPGVQRVYVVAGSDLKDGIQSLLPSLPEKDILIEPAGRSTAPCLAFAAGVVLKRHGPDTTMAVLTTDCLIDRPEAFDRNADLALDYVRTHDVLMAFGALPHCPDTGFGYIEIGPVRQNDARGKVHHVLSFREKPDQETACGYLESGRFHWNTGLFFWRCSTLLAAFDRHAPEFSAGARRLARIEDPTRWEDAVQQVFDGWPQISIDYALLEKVDNLCAIPAEFAWGDMGTWEALARHSSPDAEDNIRIGNTISIDSRRCIIYNGESSDIAEQVGKTGARCDGSDPVIALLGLEDLVVALCDSSLLICKRDRVQDVKELLAKMREEGKEEFL